MTSHLLHSDYMHWAKTHASAKYTLASSGVPDFPLSEIPYSPEDIVLTGAGSYGYPPLLEAIASRYNVAKENVVTTLGASMANFLAMAVHLQAGDEVVIESPAYELLISAARFLGANVKRFHRTFENGFQVNIKELEKSISRKTKLIVLTNLHNPSSVYTDEYTMKQIGELAKIINARVLVGEVYLPTMFDKKPFSALHLGNEFITTNSLTKTFGLSGLRLGWILAEPELAQKIWRLIDLFYVNQVTLTERLGVRAFQHIEVMSSRSKNMLDHNRALLFKFLDERNELECVRPEYGTIVFPRLKTGNVDKLFSLLQSKYETSIALGSFFDMPNHFRLGICSKSEMFEEGLKRLGLALDEM